MRKWAWNLSTQPGMQLTRISELTLQARGALTITDVQVWWSGSLGYKHETYVH